MQVVNILMYHSISDGPGPTSVSPDAFRGQLNVLDALGYRVASLADFAKWSRGEIEFGRRTVVLTFDDGFLDFATVALPELQARRWPATVFLPAGKVGGMSDWERSGTRLMDWETVKRLSEEGVDLGGHGVSHVDLTGTAIDSAVEEIVDSRKMIEDRTGRAVTNFAPPYGRTTPAIRREIARHFEASAGTRLAPAGRGSQIHDLPRIEMHYFRNRRRWREYLTGHGGFYFATRQSLRRLRAVAASIRARGQLRAETN